MISFLVPKAKKQYKGVVVTLPRSLSSFYCGCVVIKLPQGGFLELTMCVKRDGKKGTLQERVVLFHVTFRGSFFKSAIIFEAQVQ